MAATEEAESAGNAGYQGNHMSKLFQDGFSFSGFERDLLSLNLRGKRFLNISGVSGVDSISDGRGSAFADLDNDGDLDIFLVTMQRDAHFLFRNNVGERNGFIRVSLEGKRSGRDAFGTVVRVKTPAGVLTKIKSGGSGYLSQGDPRLLFGLGDAPRAEWLEVAWPGGAVQRWEDVPAGTSLVAREGASEYATVAERSFALPDPAGAEEVRMAKLTFRIGDRFPDLPLRGLDGETVSLAGLVEKGERTYLNLWATFCVPCRREMPALQKMLPRLREAGVQLVGVSLDGSTAGKVPDFLTEHGIVYPNFLAGTEAIPKIFSGDEVIIPMSFLLDAEGKVLEVLEGWSDGAEEEVLRAVEQHARR